MTEEKSKYIKQWLEKAEEDLQVYHLIMKDENPFLASAGFHLQQSGITNHRELKDDLGKAVAFQDRWTEVGTSAQRGLV